MRASQSVRPGFVGCAIDSAASRKKYANEGEPEAEKREPETDESSRAVWIRLAARARRRMHTKVQVGDDVVVDPVGEVFAPFGASDEPVLTHSIR